MSQRPQRFEGPGPSRVEPGAQLQRYRGFLQGRPLLGPQALHLDLTNTCNLDCVTCWNYGPALATPKSAAWKRQRIERALFYRAIDEGAASGVERVVLAGGGEPFTHPDIDEFIGAVKARGLKLTLITNGTLCDFERLAAQAPDQLLLNVSAASAATYRAYHPSQSEETFGRLLAGAARLREVTAVNFVQVINRLNASELVKMVELAHAHGARASFKVGALPAGTEGLGLAAEQREDLCQVLIPAARARAAQLKVRHNLEAFETALAGGRAGPPPCFAGYLYTRVSVEGRVFFCCAHLDVGHLEEGSFDEVWQAPGYQQLRARLARREWFDACERCGKHDMNFAAERELAGLKAAGQL